MIINGVYYDQSGAKNYYVNNVLHREDGPAVEWKNQRIWYKNGIIHREDGPAIIIDGQAQKWVINGKFHREDGPAIICDDGTAKWYKYGKLHREDGPAITPECAWYFEGKKYIASDLNSFLSQVSDDLVIEIINL